MYLPRTRPWLHRHRTLAPNLKEPLDLCTRNHTWANGPWTQPERVISLFNSAFGWRRHQDSSTRRMLSTRFGRMKQWGGSRGSGWWGCWKGGGWDYQMLWAFEQMWPHCVVEDKDGRLNARRLNVQSGNRVKAHATPPWVSSTYAHL
jgi:hypothetical protein